MGKRIVMEENDFNQILLCCNIASNLLMVLEQNPAVVVRDLDGDPDPGARKRWEENIHAAHDALLRARWAIS